MPESVPCPRLCSGCPVRGDVEGEPIIMTEVAWTAPGSIGKDGRSASFELVDGVPATPRISSIAIASANGDTPHTFKAKGNDWDSGRVVQTFEACGRPTLYTTGIIRKRQRIACTAIQSLQA